MVMSTVTFYKGLEWIATALGGTSIGAAICLLSKEDDVARTLGPMILLAEGIAFVALPVILKLPCMRVSDSEHQVHPEPIHGPITTIVWTAPSALRRPSASSASSVELAGIGSNSGETIRIITPSALQRRAAQVATIVGSTGNGATATRLEPLSGRIFRVA